MRQESGRSMVEMLGTLAIIGVLSIGGIAGYSYGMDKYQASTIINDVMLRAIDIMSRSEISTDDNLSGWSTTTAGKYTIRLEDETTGIQVSGLPKRLCEMVFDGLINQSTIKIGSVEYDSPTDNMCSDINTMVFYVDEENINTDNGGSDLETETETETETDTEPQTETTETTTTETTTTETTTTTTNKTTTTVTETDIACNCGSGYYCADTNGSCEHPTPSGNCVEAKPQFKEEKIDGITYYISNDPMSLWDAVSACKALGNKSLLYVSDLVEESLNDYGQYTLTQHAKLLYPKIENIEILTKDRRDCSAYTVTSNGWVSYGLDVSTPHYRAVCR